MGRRILCAAILCCGVLVATPLFAQTRDDFDYWDANGNGDLTDLPHVFGPLVNSLNRC